MPVTNCRIHGLTGCTPVCEHIGHDYISGMPLREGRRIRFTDADCDFYAWTVRLCQKCLEDFSIPDSVDVMPFEKSLDRYPQLASPNLFCSKCFELCLKQDPNWDTNSYGIEWKTGNKDFVPDGALREIHIHDTTVEDFQIVYSTLRLSGFCAFSYFVDGEKQPLPASIKEVFEVRKTASPMLSIASHIRANCHFFDIAEMEFDFDPAEVKSQRSLDDLLHFIKLIGEAVKKQVNVTYEGDEKRPFIVFDPGSKKFIHRSEPSESAFL